MTSKPLEGKIALVTGASRGLGKGIAIGLAEAGATVYITGRTLHTSEEGMGSLEETQKELEAAGGVGIPVQVDHAEDEQVRLLFERIADEQNGQLDLLVNNAYAAVSMLKETYGEPFWELEPNLWDRVNQVGLRGHYIASVYAARMMVPRKQGLICTLSSWGGLFPIFGVLYGVGKTACDRLALELALELKPHNITSLSIWPGIVGTEKFTQFAQEQASSGTLPERGNPFADGFNWETPLLTGRVIACLAADSQIIRRTGKVQIVAEQARRYGVVDREGNQPASLRSLQFILPMIAPQLRDRSTWVPNIYVPWWILMSGVLKSPQA
ncbi:MULTISPECIES: SDR family NAD(P)-dependent oxidoreductase [unclassified Roseofilum]|uniref:SDR family NAD(P)-dependent oxidoreductase n=1 Tax=unclassified Roseofilum TaxID=2620099 RepID=UPI000E816D80|nr:MULTISPECIES: SDR family NAD(P)-dependent oxidoreductase [unclassified Roseofilum]HBQ97937.1 short-chain dehydrogenase [Cyanobacteria bacterium UBA11691]MBP0008529.1 SDR family NAD(P)-dependent oxidoreductase [Roseofilum sp. Belize Diploria]MBP0012379.1 SDR family NAD(P)-dependent oxidoreductase [Roseofilum sp. SID3]MBP0026627.1 SDR family NAD(P)-dependent oxidoreductase [Roseofilum sp. SID2]MBP0035811.1 SDR family NAD(P)-dependent oxidoreductase [Roseofilum sp. Belize BBD 4]